MNPSQAYDIVASIAKASEYIKFFIQSTKANATLVRINPSNDVKRRNAAQTFEDTVFVLECSVDIAVEDSIKMETFIKEYDRTPENAKKIVEEFAKMAKTHCKTLKVLSDMTKPYVDEGNLAIWLLIEEEWRRHNFIMELKSEVIE